jgi:hypothetical protein
MGCPIGMVSLIVPRGTNETLPDIPEDPAGPRGQPREVLIRRIFLRVRLDAPVAFSFIPAGTFSVGMKMPRLHLADRTTLVNPYRVGLAFPGIP